MKKTRNARWDISPVGGLPATLGFYTSPVQKVVKRWKGQIPDGDIEDYFVSVALCVNGTRKKIELENITTGHWPFIWEVGAALTSIINKECPAKWLIILPISVMVDGKNSPWGDIALEIKKCGGLLYETNALMQQASRMKILTPVKLQKLLTSKNRKRPAVTR